MLCGSGEEIAETGVGCEDAKEPGDAVLGVSTDMPLDTILIGLGLWLCEVAVAQYLLTFADIGGGPEPTCLCSRGVGLDGV